MDRKYLHVCAATIVAATALFSCNGNNTSGKVMEVEDSVVVESVESETTANTAEADKVICSFIEDMYNNGLYENEDFLEKHCTEHLLQALREDYEYDGEGYAVWDFRTSAQDGKGSDNDTSKVISVEVLGDGWYAYEFYDAGWKGKNKVKASVVDGNVMMDAVESLYDECMETYSNEDM